MTLLQWHTSCRSYVLLPSGHFYFFCYTEVILRSMHARLACLMQRIYIALPEEKARAHMFKVHLGDTPHDLTLKDFEELAQHTEGFSGSDVAVVVKDVLMEPVRLTQDAGYFRLVLVGVSSQGFPHSGTALQT